MLRRKYGHVAAGPLQLFDRSVAKNVITRYLVQQKPAKVGCDRLQYGIFRESFEFFIDGRYAVGIPPHIDIGDVFRYSKNVKDRNGSQASIFDIIAPLLVPKRPGRDKMERIELYRLYDI